MGSMGSCTPGYYSVVFSIADCYEPPDCRSFNFTIPSPEGNVGHNVSNSNEDFNIYTVNINPIPTTCGPVDIIITGAPSVYNPNLNITEILITLTFGDTFQYYHQYFSEFNNTLVNTTTYNFQFSNEGICLFNTHYSALISLIDSYSRNIEAQWTYSFLSNIPAINGGAMCNSFQGFTIRNVTIYPEILNCSEANVEINGTIYYSNDLNLDLIYVKLYEGNSNLALSYNVSFTNVNTTIGSINTYKLTLNPPTKCKSGTKY